MTTKDRKGIPRHVHIILDPPPPEIADQQIQALADLCRSRIAARARISIELVAIHPTGLDQRAEVAADFIRRFRAREAGADAGLVQDDPGTKGATP